MIPGLGPARAETVTVAVAANALVPTRDIVAAFEAETGHEVALVPGSTGKLFAQISSGAPFDVFLAADEARPARLVSKGLARPEDRKLFAIGRLALVHGAGTEQGEVTEVLARPGLRLAIADPAVAPYGMAARQVLTALRGGDWDRGLVLGESVGQAFAFVVTGNAGAGLVGLSQARTHGGTLWLAEIDPALHDPITQDAVLLARAEDNPAARAFFDFLDSDFARTILAEAGYDLPPLPEPGI